MKESAYRDYKRIKDLELCDPKSSFLKLLKSGFAFDHHELMGSSEFDLLEKRYIRSNKPNTKGNLSISLLKELEEKPKYKMDCLSCNRMFKSVDKTHNRLCPLCNTKNNRLFNAEYYNVIRDDT